MKYVQTNIGLIPLEDHYEIQASQSGFSSYEDMKAEGYSVKEPEIIEIDDVER